MTTDYLNVEVEFTRDDCAIIERARSLMGGANYDIVIIALALAGARALLALGEVLQ